MAKPARKLGHRISDLPADIQTRVRRGFEVATGLSDDIVVRVVEYFVSKIERGGNLVETDPIAELAGIPQQDATRLVTAISIISGLASEGGPTLDEFIEYGAEKLFNSSDRAAATRIIKRILDERNTFERSYERTSLAAENLPSLRIVETTVELRPSFVGDDIHDVVAITLLHIKTDGDPEIWLQLNRGDVQLFLDKLREAAKRMDLVERAGSALISKTGEP